MTALSGPDLLGWLDRTSDAWETHLAANEDLLAVSCDTRETKNVGELLQHIVAVELRYAERLTDHAETGYADVPAGPVKSVYDVHRRASALLQPLLARDAAFWDGKISFQTRSAGQLSATRRTVLVHLAMHSIRHYAQLAVLVRHAGQPIAVPMDYLFSAQNTSPQPIR